MQLIHANITLALRMPMALYIGSAILGKILAAMLRMAVLAAIAEADFVGYRSM